LKNFPICDSFNLRLFCARRRWAIPTRWQPISKILCIETEATDLTAHRPGAVVNLICFTPLLLLMLGYDWWSKGKVQRVTIWSTIFMVVVQQIRHPLGHTAVWQSFAAWVAIHMPSFS
jgi:hypothetical protein